MPIPGIAGHPKLLTPTPAAGGGAPAYTGETTNYHTNLGQTFTITIPSGCVVGNLFVIFCSRDGTLAQWGTSEQAASNVTGITRLHSGTTQGHGYAVYYKVLESGDPGDTVTIQTGADDPDGITVVAAEFENCDSIEASSVASGAGTAPDPPSHTYSGGGTDYLSVMSIQADRDHITAISSGYTEIDNQTGTSHNADSHVAVGYKTPTSATENPGTGTLNASDGWSAHTYAIFQS